MMAMVTLEPNNKYKYIYIYKPIKLFESYIQIYTNQKKTNNNQHEEENNQQFQN